MLIFRVTVAIFGLGLAVQGKCLSNSSVTDHLPCSLDVAINQTRMFTVSKIKTSDVTASVFSETNPVHASLFGRLRDMEAKPSELDPYVHPRIVVGPAQWDDLLSMYADPENFDKDGTWSKFFRLASLKVGPQSSFILDLAELERNGSTAAYLGRPYSTSSSYQSYRNGLEALANRIVTSSAANSDSFPICALWGSVALQQRSEGRTPFLDPTATIQTCIKAAVAWAKIVLAHRTYYCNPDCPKYGPNHAELWNTERMFSLHHNWFLGGTGIAFTYDLLYEHISANDRVAMRSAVAMFVMNRWAWGASETSTRLSPSAKYSPHRIFSNWAGYNSNLYLANLAIEGETGFDEYSSSTLAANGASGFNKGLHFRYSALLKQFMLHSFYPDGSTFEDGYSYFTALREGSLGLLASHRRGSNVLGSPRFRNIVHNAAQMHEPWHCGTLIGHASGGGILYNAYVALFRYVFPDGELPGMLWRQRFGDFRHNRPCRILWIQSILQLAFLGGEHSSTAESPEFLNSAVQKHFKLSYYAPRRGLLIARSSLSEMSTYMHFDARPDAFLLGHDNADRGVFTFTALRQTWLDDLDWSRNLDSRKHSLMHIDGLAQDMKAPSGKMLKVTDNGQVVIAAADLTYTYNVQWARNHNYYLPPTQHVTVYNEDGFPINVPTLFAEKENFSPWALGWPANDRAQDIGFTESMSLNGVENIGFMGLWIWKRPYREVPLSHMVRSSVLVRSDKNDIGYGIIADSVAAGSGSHAFESYLILQESVFLDENLSDCSQNRCKLVLSTGDVAKVDIHVFTKGYSLSYRTEMFDGTKTRLILRSVREWSEEFWLVLHPHEGTPDRLSVQQTPEGHHKISYLGDVLTFGISFIDHAIQQVKTEPQSEPTPSVSAAPISQASSRLPMLPKTLVHGKKIRMTSGSMTTDKTKFFSHSVGSRQVVFNFTSVSDAALDESDKFSACFAGTTAVTTMEVYDCGGISEALKNYLQRICHKVGMSSVTDRCSTRSVKTKYIAQLQKWKVYYLVVSVFNPLSDNPQLDLLHTASKGSPSTAIVSPSASPSPLTGNPMQPIVLKWKKVVAEPSMISDKNQFYHNTDAKYQLVFQVRSKSNPELALRDLFVTCSADTTVSTTLTLYDCGEGAMAQSKYQSRHCVRVGRSNASNSCRGFRTRYKRILVSRKKYFLVVSIYPRDDAPALTIRHGKTKTS